MRRIALSIALAALALSGVPSANAGSVSPQPLVAADTDTAAQTTDVSARRRHWRGWYGHHRVVGAYPRYYRSYGYYPPPYYYYGPAVSFGIGYGGGPRFYRSRYHAPWLGVGY